MTQDERFSNFLGSIKQTVQPSTEKMETLLSDINKNIKSLDLKVDAPIINVPKADTPIVNVKAPIVNVPETVVNVPETVVNVTEKIIEFPKVQNVKITNPQTEVTIVDKEGRPVSFGGSGGAFAAVDIKNASGEKISPATEEKQDAIISALGNVKIDTGDISLNTDEVEEKLDEIISTNGGIAITQIDGSQKTQIVDGTGLVVGAKTNSNTNKNELLVNLEGHQCTSNSTETPLSAGATFTGSAWQDTLDYGVLSIDVRSDQASATNGLVIQWSHDGTNVNNTDTFTIMANTPKTFTFGPAERYYRVVYTNGSVDQTSFHLTSLLRRCYVKPSSHRIQDSIIGEDDAELVKSVTTGLDDYGIFQNAKVDSTGRLNTVSQPYLFSIAEGTTPNHTALLKFGTRTSVAAGTPSVVWEGPTALYTYMTTAEQLKVSSSSGNDIATTGTGARTLILIGLDGNYDEISETINMNGTSVVTTSSSFLRIFRAYVETAGTSATNEGVITITNNAGTVTQAVINATDGQTLMTIWTVPRGKTAYLTNSSFSTDSNKGARVSMFTRELDGGTLYPYRIRYRAFIFSGNENFPFSIPFKIPEKTDIEIRVSTPLAAGTTSCGATFELWYE